MVGARRRREDDDDGWKGLNFSLTAARISRGAREGGIFRVIRYDRMRMFFFGATMSFVVAKKRFKLN